LPHPSFLPLSHGEGEFLAESDGPKQPELRQGGDLIIETISLDDPALLISCVLMEAPLDCCREGHPVDRMAGALT
jgi:hypothetical protein